MKTEPTRLATWVFNHILGLAFGVAWFIGSFPLAMPYQSSSFYSFLCMVAPLGFVTLLKDLTAQPNDFNAPFVAISTILGYVIGSLLQRLWQRDYRAGIAVLSFIVLNSCGFIWYLIQSFEID